MNGQRSIRAHGQRGAVLVIVLILLLVMTWMGVASMRGTSMGERMSAGIYDRSISFQAAEAALREAEALIALKPVFPTSDCNAGLCAQRVDLAASDTMRWEDSTVAWREAVSNLDVDNSGTSIRRSRIFDRSHGHCSELAWLRSGNSYQREVHVSSLSRFRA